MKISARTPAFVAALSACSSRRPLWPAPVARKRRRRERGGHTGGRPSATDAPIPPTASPYDALPEPVRLVMDKPFTGDFDALVARRSIRVAVTFNRTHYFIDKGQERGLTYETLKLFEKDLNEDLKTGNLKVHVVIVPMPRDQLYAALASGKVDMVAAMVTVTARVGEARRLLGPDADERERSRGHRARRAADRHGGRSRRPGGVRPQREHL